MTEKMLRAASVVLSLLMLMTMLCACGGKNDTAKPTEPETEEKLTDEQALAAIRNYCYKKNPTLEDIVNAGEYTVYWNVTSSDEHEIVVLFRSYTGAEIRYYIDRITGETSVTEYVFGITPEEQKTEERFNVREYLTKD